MTDDTASRPLTPRQSAFVSEYLKDLNATQAAIRAGYSPRTAASIGQENLTKPEIAARIAQAQGVRAERASLDAQTVLEGLLSEARGEGPDSASSSRVAAWKLIGQHIGMWKEKEGDSTRPVQLNFNFKPLTQAEIEAEKARQAQDA